MVRLRVCGGVCGVVLACGVVRVCKSVRGKCRRNLTRHAISAVLLSPRTARQSEDCLRDARPTQSGASRTAGSAYGGGISRPAHSVSAEFREALWRRTAGYRARIRRKARNPTAPAQRGAWSEYLPSRRASACAASCASRRLRLLRLVPPPPRLASRPISAWMAQMERCKRQRLRRHSANSAGGMGGADHVARADSAPRCARRREAALQGAGRYPDQAMQGALADGLRIAGKSGIRGGGVASRPEPPTRPCQPRAASPPQAERPLRRAMAERGGRTRRQSSDCRAVRTDAPARSAQGEARLGRSGAHAVEARQRHSIRRQGAKHTAPHTQHPHENG